MRSIIFLAICIVCSIQSYSQISSGLVAYYSFDDGNVLDQTVNQNHGTVSGAPTYSCGVKGDAIRFNGLDDYIDFIGNVNTYFRGNSNFSVNFYFRATGLTGTHDIFGKRQTCGVNNYFSIKFTPSTRMLAIDVAESVDRTFTVRERLNPNRCWYMITVSKDRNSVKVYVDSEEIFSESYTGLFETDNAAPLSIANGPCLGITDRRFEGLIDELRIYNRALTQADLNELYTFPEQIIPRDTVVYKGFEFSPRKGTSCAEIVSWEPMSGVTEPDVWNTSLSPEDTTTYIVTNIIDGCVSIDTLEVNVIDAQALPCQELFMATAFTPNGDGTNDTYGLSNPFNLDELQSFQIFDRWGSLIFETTDNFGQWDGRFKGKLLEPNSYVYRIRYICKGEEVVQNGEFLLLR